MRALQRCDFCDEQAAGTFEIVPEELDPTEAERRRVVLCDSCRAQLETLIEPLLDRAGTGPTESSTPAQEETERVAEAETETESEGLIGASDDGSLLGGDEGSDATEDETDSTADSQTVHSADAGTDDPPENYGKVLRLLRNREFPMSREEVVTIATSAYSLSARNVQQIIDESVDRGEFVETDGQLEQA